MTSSEVVAAAMVVLQRFGIADEQELYNLLPAVVARFVESNIWEHLVIGPVSVSPVAGQEYLGIPNNFLKVDSLWSQTQNRTLEFRNRKTWSRYKAANPTASGSPEIYTQIGGRVYTFPPAGSGEVFKLTYHPTASNITVEQLPFGHYAIVQMLIEDWLPTGKEGSGEAIAKAFYAEKAKDALAEAVAVQNLQPDTQEDEQLDRIQQMLNIQKGGPYVPRSPFTR